MKKLLALLIVLALMVGIGAGVGIYLRRRHRQAYPPWAANPCRDGLAVADNTIEPTLKIRVLETSCEKQSAGVHFSVTNVGTTPIKYFRVRAVYTYEHYVDDGAEVGTGPLTPDQSDDSYFGMGPPRLAQDKPVGDLRSITLITSQLDFEDGKKWRRPSIQEPAPKRRPAKTRTDERFFARVKGESMKNLVTILIASLFAFSLLQVSVAQETKESPLKAATSKAGSARDEPKGEVEAAIEELKKAGEGVLVVSGKESDPGNAIPGAVINGRAIELVQPAYPAMARAAKASGEVVVWVLIDKEGKVRAAQVIDGHPLLRAAAVRAAKSSRFTPTLIDNQPVNVSGRIVYSFAKM